MERWERAKYHPCLTLGVNGTRVTGSYAGHSSENAELITGILRGEWGYKGAMTTDWWNTADHAHEIAVGNDIRISSGDIKKLKKDFEAGIFSRQQLAACVKRIFEMILRTH